MHITTHLDGLHAALVNFRIGELWIGRDEEIPAFKSLVEEAHSRGIRVVDKEGEHSSSTAKSRAKCSGRPIRSRKTKRRMPFGHPAQAAIERYENRGRNSCERIATAQSRP